MYYAFYSDLNLTFPFTVKVESEQEAIDLQHTVASFLNLDVTKVDRSNAFVYSSRLGKITMESVMAAIDIKVPLGKVAWTYMGFNKKAWFGNISLKKSKEIVTEEEKKKVINEMLRRLGESFQLEEEKVVVQ